MDNNRDKRDKPTISTETITRLVRTTGRVCKFLPGDFIKIEGEPPMSRAQLFAWVAKHYDIHLVDLPGHLRGSIVKRLDHGQ